MKHTAIRQRLAADLAAMLTAGSLPITLFPYQRETFESKISWLEDKKGLRRGYVSQATGLGKTIEFAALISACAGLRVLVIEPGKQLVEQTVRRLVGFTSGTIAHASSLRHIRDAKNEIIASRWKDKSHDVLVTTDETLKLSFRRIKTELDPHVIVWDECHWAYTAQAQAALQAFPEAIIIAFSATPDYLGTVAKANYVPVTLDNGQVLYGDPNRFARAHFGQLLDERTARWGIHNDWLAPLAWGQVEFQFSLEDVPTVQRPEGMDYDPAALQKLMAENWPFVIRVIRDLYLSGQYDLGRRFSAAICPGVTEAYALADAINKIGVPSACITNKTPDTERDKILTASSKGHIGLLTSVFVLREGWDAPNAEVAMMLRPTKSRLLYMQFMGRVLRKYRDKIALVLDPHYQNTQFSPLSAPVLLGEPEQEIADGGYLVRPKVKEGAGSILPRLPYWVRRFHPVLKIQPLEMEYWADQEGKFQADGEIWFHTNGLRKLLGLSVPTIQSRLGSSRQRTGKDTSGKLRTFYSLSDAKSACEDLLVTEHQADEKGKLTANGEDWGTLKYLERTLALSEKAIASRVDTCRVLPGKDQTGQVRTFYSLLDAKEACKDLLEVEHHADDEGKFKAEGEVWVTINGLRSLLGLSGHSIRARVQSCRHKQGIDAIGTRRVFYSLADAKKACKNVRPYRREQS
jgi:superfamily II DNA or RNA helicase